VYGYPRFGDLDCNLDAKSDAELRPDLDAAVSTLLTVCVISWSIVILLTRLFCEPPY